MTAPDVASTVIAAVHSGDLGTLRQLVEEATWSRILWSWGRRRGPHAAPRRHRLARLLP